MGFLQILLLILKIIGILFAFAIGVLLLAVVLLLFVPVRYRLKGHKAEDYGIEAKVSWLLHLVRMRVSYAKDKSLLYEVRLLWFLILSNDEAWKKAHEEKKARKEAERKRKQKAKRAKQKAKRKKKQGQYVVTTDKPAVRTKEPDKPEAGSVADVTGEDATEQEIPQQEVTQPKEKWFIRIRNKVISIVRSVKQKIKAFSDTVKNLWQKADSVVSFLKDETNKAAFGASWTTLVQILKHLGPTKVRGYLAFGTGDPAATGYILAVFGIFYGKFGKSFSICPNFEEKQFETEMKAKGRIRMSRLIRLGWKLWKNKDFKSLLDNINQLKNGDKSNGG